jgi:hypothetical protein
MKEKEAKQIVESEFGDLEKEDKSQYNALVSLLVKYGAEPQPVQNSGNYVPNLDNITEVKTILIGNHKWKIAGDVTVPKDEIWAVNADGTKQVFKI